MTLKIDRCEVCKVLSALTATGNASDNAEFYHIHEKIKNQLDEWDEKHTKPNYERKGSV